MVKQNASMDASFWINCCAGGIVEYAPLYFRLFVTTPVVEEVRYPATNLGMLPYSVELFDAWLGNRRIVAENPESSFDWFQPGENAAIALAAEKGYWLLIDDANAFHRAKHFGLRVVGTADFTILLYDQAKITLQQAQEALNGIRISIRQRRQALALLESLARRKGER